MNFLSQRRTALLAAAAFVLATIAIPALHLTFHALPHDHAGGETHYHPPAAHGHDHEAEHHHEAPEREPFDPTHGDGSTAHFSAAISDGAAASFSLPVHALTPERLAPATPGVPSAAAHVSVQRFRGPPHA
ncbi:MAG TPA: hypothetical protein VGF28_22770 [Thermoanaerobaculia bacterium]